METADKVICYSRFFPKSDADGGFRRTSQIVEALKGLDYEFLSAGDFSSEFYASGYKEGRQYREYCGDDPISAEYLEKWSSARRNNIAYLHHVAWLWQRRLQSGRKPKLALVDDPIYFSPLINYLSSKDIPIVAHCHNLESLSRSQIIGQYQMELLNYEIRLLSLCSLVITISREETFFLRNLGINAFFYPYYPVRALLDRMIRVRRERERTGKEHFLMLGTAHNPPTRAGMMNIMKCWKEISANMHGARLFVGGYGTEPLKEFSDGRHVVYKGVLSNQDLDELLGSVKACIVYQGDGAGALTKICEFLLSGVPVLANSHAARSYHNLPGVVEFDDVHSIERASCIIDSPEIVIKAPEAPDPHALLLQINSIRESSSIPKDGTGGDGLKEMLSSVGEQGFDITTGNQGRKKTVSQMITESENELRAERDAIARERDALLGSLSWRVTAPLRYIGKFFMKR